MLWFLFLLTATITNCQNAKTIGSVEIPIEEIPYQGSVESLGFHRCSAAILSSKYILMTAVCAERFRVNLDIATFRFGTTSRLYEGLEYRCANMSQHPKYDIYNNTFEQKDYDVAVAQVYPELAIDGKTITPINLTDSLPAVGTVGKMSGWGALSDGGAIMVYARARNTTISSQSACREVFDDVFPVTDRMFCAGDPDGVVCDGDLGSLLTVGGVLVGMYSWGYGCGQSGIPDVFVNLANPEVREFIRNYTSIWLWYQIWLLRLSVVNLKNKEKILH